MPRESNSGAQSNSVGEAEVSDASASADVRRSWADSRPRPSGLAVVIASFVGNLYLVVGTIFFATLALLIGWLPPRGNGVYRVARWWSRSLLFSSGVSADAHFETEIDPDGHYIFMANHQSLFDIPALIATLPGQTRFLAKRSLFQIPIFGWALKLGGFVTIDREDGKRAMEAFAIAAQRLASGKSILIFPEGTRSTDGRLLPFKRGGLLLAIKSGLPIVPVGIRGTIGVRPRNRFSIRPMPVEVHYGSPIVVADYGVRHRKTLETEVRARIAELAETEA